MNLLLDVTIISEQYLKENSSLNLNISTEKLRPAIIDAQTIQIQTVLGTKLLKRILSDISNNTLSGNYITLVDEYVIPALLKWSVYHSTLDISFQMYNKGIMQRTSEFAQPSNIKDIQYLRQEIRNEAEFLSERLRIYLCENSNLFVEYLSEDDLISKKRTAYNSLFAFREYKKSKFLK